MKFLPHRLPKLKTSLPTLPVPKGSLGQLPLPPKPAEKTKSGIKVGR